MNIELIESPPSVADYISLRHAVGWGETDVSQAQKSLDNSLYHVIAKEEGKTVGMCRVVGDGALFFYIQDLVVSPEHQGLGIGKLLMEKVEFYLNKSASKGATIGLFSALGKEPFYLKYDYVKRDGEHLGSGMCKFI